MIHRGMEGQVLTNPMSSFEFIGGYIKITCPVNCDIKSFISKFQSLYRWNSEMANSIYPTLLTDVITYPCWY